MVVYPERGAGNDPKPFFLRGGGGGGWGGGWEGDSLSPPRLNIFTVGNMGVMICLDQGGLRSLSASSYESLGLHAEPGSHKGHMESIILPWYTIHCTKKQLSTR